MRLTRRAGVVAVGLAAVAVAVPVAISHDGGPLLRSGVAGSTPPAAGGPTLFGVVPGGAPWVADSDSRIKLTRSGKLEAEIVGLVIPGRTPPNPLATLSASVVCNGKVVATTGTVPFSPEGNAEVEAQVSLPDTCLAPAVLINPLDRAGIYIGASG